MALDLLESCEAWYPPCVGFSSRPGIQAELIYDDIPPETDHLWDVENGASGRPCKEGEAGLCSRFLSLPLELRLCIYHWVHLMNPIRHEEPIPGYPIPEHCRYVLQPIRREENIEETPDPCPTTTSRVLSADRPFAGLPTGLLCTCKQIYYEARAIPFATNEFVFPNWFSSGLHAASAVTSAQLPWQRNAVRYVRLEVRAVDLHDPAALRKWAELCGHGSAWAGGLRGLRLKIVGPDGSDSEVEADGDGLVGAVRGWVEGAGLGRMRKLERLEIELVKPAWQKDQKLTWCEELQKVMWEMGSGVEVGCMERVV